MDDEGDEITLAIICSRLQLPESMSRMMIPDLEEEEEEEEEPCSLADDSYHSIFFPIKLSNGSKGFRRYGKKTGGPLKSLGVKVHCNELITSFFFTTQVEVAKLRKRWSRAII